MPRSLYHGQVGGVVRGSGLPCGWASADLGMAEKLGMF